MRYIPEQFEVKWSEKPENGATALAHVVSMNATELHPVVGAGMRMGGVALFASLCLSSIASECVSQHSSKVATATCSKFITVSFCLMLSAVCSRGYSKSTSQSIEGQRRNITAVSRARKHVYAHIYADYSTYMLFTSSGEDASRRSHNSMTAIATVDPTNRMLNWAHTRRKRICRTRNSAAKDTHGLTK